MRMLFNTVKPLPAKHSPKIWCFNNRFRNEKKSSSSEYYRRLSILEYSDYVSKIKKVQYSPKFYSELAYNI